MPRMFRRSTDSAIVCESCLPPMEVMVAAELSPDFFPGTFHKLQCAVCSAQAKTLDRHEGDARET